MSVIKIENEELEKIANDIKELVQNREEQNDKIKKMLYDLDNQKTEGFIEKIIYKIEEHTINVDNIQIDNLNYSVEFIKDVVNNFTEVDENIIKK